ncbi:hypothetical protein DL93DRAFT_770987 [Clavulina sp. PMI_390]|nr:hypothetical protein DL93DRAFT_770987 [Clavulina sp. PMI_390]
MQKETLSRAFSTSSTHCMERILRSVRRDPRRASELSVKGEPKQSMELSTQPPSPKIVKNLNNLWQKSFEDVVRLEPRQSKIGLATLPEDVLIEVMCQSLSLSDIVALSHTCRAIRLCTEIDVVWIHALRHQPHSVPDFSPLYFVNPNNDSEEHPTLSVDYSLATTTSTVVSLGEPTLHRPAPSLRDRYWAALRARTLTSRPTVSVEVTAIVLFALPPFQGVREMGFSSGGEVFWAWYDQGIQLLDLRSPHIISYRIDYSAFVPKQDKKAPRWRIAVWGRWKGEEGVMFASGQPSENKLELFFQPIPRTPVHSESGSPGNTTCPSPVFMYTVFPDSELLDVHISGTYLIAEVRGDFSSKSLRMIDLASGRTFLLLNAQTVLHSEVVDDRYLLVASRSTSTQVSFYPLHSLNQSAFPANRPPQLHAPTGPQVEQLQSLPRSFSLNSATSKMDLAFWRHRRNEWSGSSRVTLLRGSTVIVQGEIVLNSPTQSGSYSAELLYPEVYERSLDWQRVVGRGKPGNDLEGIPVVAVSSVQGYDRLLSLVTSRPSGSQQKILASKGLPSIRSTIVVTEVAPSGDCLVHKPLYLRDGAGNVQPFSSLGMVDQLRWNEASGRIAVKVEGPDPSAPWSISLFHVC